MSTTRESSPVRPLMTPPDVSEPRAWASRQSLGRIQPHDLVEAPEPDVQRGVGDQLDDLGLREVPAQLGPERVVDLADRKSTRLNSSHRCISYAVFCLKKKKKINV